MGLAVVGPPGLAPVATLGHPRVCKGLQKRESTSRSTGPDAGSGTLTRKRRLCMTSIRSSCLVGTCYARWIGHTSKASGIFLRAVDHNECDPDHRRRASTTLVELINGVTREELPPDYDDPYVAAAYVVKYHLSHCMMAYWSFGLLLDRVGVPNALYVCDAMPGPRRRPLLPQPAPLPRQRATRERH